MLGYALGHPFKAEVPEERAFTRAMEAAEILFAKEGMVTEGGSYAFQMWFMLVEKAFSQGYDFKNPTALAAAVEYMVKSSRNRAVTKKEISGHFGITSATLTKYINDLIRFLPLFES